MICNSCFSEKENRKSRLACLQKELLLRDAQAFVLENPIDLAYFTGLQLSAGQLWIAKGDVLLLVDGRYTEMAEKAGYAVAALSQDKAKSFLQKNHVKVVGFDGAKMSFDRVQALQKTGKEFLWINTSFLTRPLRWIKDAYEIQCLQNSAHLLWQGFLYVKDLLKEGISEREIARAFTIFCLEKGAEGLSFEPIIAFGENSAMPHHRAGDRLLQDGDVVLIDIGVVLNKYHSDMTRVVFFGEQDPLIENWLKLAIEAHGAALRLCKPGTKIKELDLAARKIFAQNEVESHFCHSLGHGIGLEVHESPKIRFEGEDSETVLQVGMVFTIEPGLYFPNKGGVRYEDTIVITEDGFLNLFPDERVFTVK